VPFTGSPVPKAKPAATVATGRRSTGEAVMTLHLPPNDILLALFLATVLILLASGADLPAEEEPP
jgi:hypothetical protein